MIAKGLLNRDAYKKACIHSLTHPPIKKICFEHLSGMVLGIGEKNKRREVLIVLP